jgi:hypothetical protein
MVVDDPGRPGRGEPVALDTPRVGAPPAAQATGDTTVQRLEREARALARSEGCEQGSQCRAAPVGSRPCGGPRDYLVYCSLTTDSAALYRKLDELARAEDAYNQRSGMMSTCEFRVPPGVDAVGGRCVARVGQ